MIIGEQNRQVFGEFGENEKRRIGGELIEVRTRVVTSVVPSAEISLKRGNETGRAEIFRVQMTSKARKEKEKLFRKEFFLFDFTIVVEKR